jgi:hypothetical protein
MKTLRARILVPFWTVAALTILAIGVVVSWRLSQGISQQASMITNDMTVQVNESLDSYHHMLEVFIRSIKEDVQRAINDICNDQNIIANMESDRVKALIPAVESVGKNTSMDFIVLFDLQGMHLASFPADMDTFWLKNNYKSRDILSGDNNQAKADAESSPNILNMVTKHNPDFLKAVGLGDRDIFGKGAISILSEGIIHDDFGEPLATCIVGKLLNHNNEPLKQLYNVSGAAGVIYLDTAPIAYAGFEDTGANRFDPSHLSLSRELQISIYGADKPLHMKVTLGDKPYLTTCSAIKSDKGEKVGSILVGIPEAKVIASQEAMLSYGIRTKNDVQTWIIGIGGMSLLVFTLVAIIIATQVTKLIGRTGDSLKETMNQIASASGEVADASQHLAERTGEQASFLEETSSSLEEMSSQTKQNAESAIHANRLMNEATRIIERANESMTELITSMKEISEASTETSKIIKTIDEVAFQTNLLALNAAVEAARAGEAGAGFAVVADEVRNLAMRAAEASKNTEELIQDTSKKVQSGSDLVTKTSADFSEILTSASKVGDLINEIAAASNEQSEGITQISQAVHQVDKTTQMNVAHAEQFASVSEEMNAQVEQMTMILGELISLIGKDADQAGAASGKAFRPNAPRPTHLNRISTTNPTHD